MLRDTVSLSPHSHRDKPARLGNLCICLRARFQRLGELSDLENAVSILRDVLELTPHEQAISRQRDVVDLSLRDDVRRPAFLESLSNSLFARFQRFGNHSDLEAAISMSRQLLGRPVQAASRGSNIETAISTLTDAVDLTPHGHVNRPTCLKSLGGPFKARFEHLGELGDLEEAISRYMDAVELTPPGRPDRPAPSPGADNNFLDRDAVDLTPPDHPNMPNRLSNLGLSLNARFERLGERRDVEDAISTLREARLGEPHDLEEAISTFRDAIDLAAPGHPDRSSCVSNLGVSFLDRFDRHGERSDLKEAIAMLRDALGLSPPDHSEEPRLLNNLGGSSVTRFNHFGVFSDLEVVISLLIDAVNLTPPGHPDRPTILNTLAGSFLARFERLGELSNLETPVYLSDLGNSFFTRFGRLGEPSDLKAAISTLSDAAGLTPRGHPLKPYCLNNLGLALNARFERHGELRDFETAISMLTDAVDLTPHGHPNRHICFNNLGTFLLSCFQSLEELSDLEAAILMLRNAVDLTPHGHPFKPRRLHNLCLSLKAPCIDMTPTDHPDKSHCLDNLAGSFFARFEHLGESSDLEQAISLYSRAASASLLYDFVHHKNGYHVLGAYTITHPSMHILLPLTCFLNSLREAAAAALDAGLPETAVEWLEQGRSIVWGELRQLRSSYEELSDDPDHARRLRELSVALEHASATRETSSESALLEETQSAAHRATGSLQREADKQRMLAIERDQLLQEIRGFPGFERFLHVCVERFLCTVHTIVSAMVVLRLSPAFK
ncbi:hypothetical protein JVT61DRAFT_9850 [Boletus reticuloceps]|uniref:Uncharacterized protein n=1 Tax=Boletus reticuloceps TaxID=495285 RepID=A0A8I3A656_9AGAM|nr:hypothetical protein JVT61DRAFT_9850 [Boletus reticuloceps]